MNDAPREPTTPPEVVAFYDRTPEESRLDSGPFRLELERTKEILLRILPPPPARVVDVGGGAGPYSLWLAARGYEAHLVDASPRLVEEARRRSAASASPLASIEVADARRVPQPDGAADAVLVMGPLYHLPLAAERRRALLEALRMARPGALVAAAAISRFAVALTGATLGLAADARFRAIRDRGLADGQHRNDTGDDNLFTTAFLHRPEDLLAEMEAAGLEQVRILGIEGPGWTAPDFESVWADPVRREDLLRLARAVEAEPSITGASAHLLGIGRRPAAP